MLKRIIFDLDNTLMPWKDEYIFALRSTLDDLNIKYTSEQLLKFDSTIVDYEKYHDTYTNREFVDFINKICNSKLPYEFADKLIDYQGKCFDNNDNLADTLNYLSKKYDLVILSNWFTKTQKTRLENAGILKYFSQVSGGDERPLKPDKTAFMLAIGDLKPEECMMVGDSLKNDIVPALELGLSAIWITDKTDICYKTLDKVEKLIDIL